MLKYNFFQAPPVTESNRNPYQATISTFVYALKKKLGLISCMVRPWLSAPIFWMKKNSSFHFWKFFERIFDSNVINYNIYLRNTFEYKQRECLKWRKNESGWQWKKSYGLSVIIANSAFLTKKSWKRLLRSLKKKMFSDFSEILQPPHLVIWCY